MYAVALAHSSSFPYVLLDRHSQKHKLNSFELSLPPLALAGLGVFPEKGISDCSCRLSARATGNNWRCKLEPGSFTFSRKQTL